MNDSPPLADRVAVVTGAAGGIGQEVCVDLADRGAIVVATDIRQLDETRDRLNGAPHHFVSLDVTSPQRTAALAERVESELGRCDILVNNAARLESVSWDELDLELWRAVIAVNLDGPMLMCKALVPLMRRGGWGRIINVSSGSVMQPMPGSIAYRASKMGLIGFTRALSAELGEHGITINAVCPSITDTPMATAGIPPEHITAMVSRQAVKRIARADDISAIVALLVSPDARWITGQTILANSGGSFL
jgi:NAD(P)-dependent dehydrogenase (short-subunit alcohol dehydrogenase family)